MLGLNHARDCARQLQKNRLICMSANQNSGDYESQTEPQKNPAKDMPPEQPATKTKGRAAWAVIFGTLATLFLGAGGILLSIDHKLAELSVTLFSIGGILSGFCLGLLLRNLNQSKRVYDCWRYGIVGGSILLWLFGSFWLYEMPTTPQVSQEVSGITFKEEVQKPILVFGGNEMGMGNVSHGTRESPVTPVRIGNTPLLKMYVENGVFFCDAEVFTGNGLPPIKLEHNSVTGTPDDWHLNFNDTAIEIVNSNLVPMFQLHYENASRIVINGVFITGTGIVLATDTGEQFIPASTLKTLYPNGKYPIVILKPLFKYPEWKHKGQFSED
jgi:hypothetical protein